MHIFVDKFGNEIGNNFRNNIGEKFRDNSVIFVNNCAAYRTLQIYTVFNCVHCPLHSCCTVYIFCHIQYNVEVTVKKTVNQLGEEQIGLQFGSPDFLTPLAPLGARQYWSEKNFGHLDHCVPDSRVCLECQSIDLNFRNQVASKLDIHFLQNN